MGTFVQRGMNSCHFKWGRTGSIAHAAIRQGSPGVFAVPPGVSLASFGLYLEASIERQEDSRLRCSKFTL